MSREIYIEYSKVVETIDEYAALTEALNRWASGVELAADTTANVNSGNAPETFVERSKVYLYGTMESTQDMVECMNIALEQTRHYVKNLILCCDHFFEILHEGQEVENPDDYDAYAIGSNDKLYFNDKHFPDEDPHEGDISSETGVVDEGAATTEDNLDYLEDLLPNLRTTELDICRDIEALRECVEKERRAKKLQDQLCKYTDGVKSFEEEVSKQMKSQLPIFDFGQVAHMRSYRYDPRDASINSYIMTYIDRALEGYGVTLDDINAALKHNITKDMLASYFAAFESDQASECFLRILRGEYENAFLDLDSLNINDSALMTAISKYSFSILELDKDGYATAESCAEFERFLSGICMSGNRPVDVQEILKQLYACAAIQAEADQVVAAAMKCTSEEYDKLYDESIKNVAVAYLYKTLYLGVQNSSCVSGIQDFKYANGNMYLNFIGAHNKLKSVKITKISTSEGFFNANIDDQCKELEDAKAALAGQILADILRNGSLIAATAADPLLGASVKLLYGLTSPSISKTSGDTVSCVNAILKANGVNLSKTTTDSISLVTKSIEDVMKFRAILPASADQEMKKYAGMMFGFYFHGAFYGDDIIQALGSGDSSDYNSQFYNQINVLNPKAVESIEAWEQKGLKGLCDEVYKDGSEDIENALNGYLENFDNPAENANKITVDLTKEEVVQIKAMFYGCTDGNALDFSQLDINEFYNACVKFDQIMSDQGLDGITAMDIWHDYIY